MKYLIKNELVFYMVATLKPKTCFKKTKALMLNYSIIIKKYKIFKTTSKEL